MGLMNEYINRRLGASELAKELLSLIAEYNKKRGTFLLVFASAIGKNIPDVELSQEDFYIVSDLLKDKVSLIKKVDIYLETPGGSGEAAEEIVNFLRHNFEDVSFVVSGEAKSAGTIMVLSGDEILMTKTGSLGPIDAQMRIGRTVVSAFDYTEWIEKKYKEAEEKGRLNPFDATMIAQISPGELFGVQHALKFAEDLVIKWLIKYKFKNWRETETRKIPVTDDIKKKRAKEIVDELINHAKWRSHGRSIKIDDLENIKLKITKIDEDAILQDIVYRIQTVCRLLFTTSSTYKIFATQDEKIFKQAIGLNSPVRVPQLPKSSQMAEIAEVDIQCQKCGKKFTLYAKFIADPKIDKDFQAKGSVPFPKDNKLQCDCGFQIDVGGIRNELEIKAGSKVLD